MRPRIAPRRAGSSGFTYLGLMFLVAVLALTASMASVVWSTAQQRGNERELVFVGRQFQAAIERYQQRSKGTDARYPRRLEDLLRDVRAVQVERPLRRLYIDPMTGRADWGLIRNAQGGIVGVYSLSGRKPMPGTLRAAGFAGPDSGELPTEAATYRSWRFIAPSAAVSAAAASAPAPGARAAQ